MTHEHDEPHAPRQRPSWWPPDQPWPPEHGPWHPSRHWSCRVAIALAVMLLIGLFLCALILAAGLLFFSVVPARVEAPEVPSLPQLPSLPDLPTPPGNFWRPAGACALTLIVLMLLFIGVRAVRRVSVPITELLDASGRIARGDYRARISERGPREMRAVARAFNGMATRLQEHDERRRHLLADVTHELRTPLTVIQGNLEGMLDGIYPRDDEHITPILEETRVLSRLIDDLRTLSLVETGALQLQKEATDLAALAGETAASFRSYADAAGVTLAVEVAGSPALLDVDPARIREVLLNLMSNAVRYTAPGGRVCIRVRAEAGEPAVVAVADTGRGIAPDELPHIFDRFYKSSDSRGTGLGLTIAKNLVTAHGGDITAESTAGEGTTVTFTLPRSA